MDKNKKIQLKQERYLKALKVAGVIGLAMEKAGIKSRQTLLNWRKKYPDFAEEETKILLNYKEKINDLAEAKLIQAIRKGDGWAIKFRLQTHHEGYKPKQEIELKDKEKIDTFLEELSKILNDKETSK